jgi:hypothetical protein
MVIGTRTGAATAGMKATGRGLPMRVPRGLALAMRVASSTPVTGMGTAAALITIIAGTAIGGCEIATAGVITTTITAEVA